MHSELQGEVLESFQMPGGAWVRVLLGDLTEQRVDAVVNAANPWLAHGGGVAGAIVRKGGARIQSESSALPRPVPVGGVAVTSAGNLPARYVIHAVGPRWGEGEEARKLYSAVSAALLAAKDRGLTSMALPAISTGIYGYPVDKAARILVDAVLSVLGALPDGPLRDVRLVLLDPDKARLFAKTLRERARWVPPLSP